MNNNENPKRRRQFGLRFKLRSLLLAFVLIGIALSYVVWWLQPYEMVWYDQRGVIRQRNWVRRTLTGRFVDVESRPYTEYYANGEKSFEVTAGQSKMWSPSGEPIATHEEFGHYHFDDPSYFPWSTTRPAEP